jgi:hypothetical protein
MTHAFIARGAANFKVFADVHSLEFYTATRNTCGKALGE